MYGLVWLVVMFVGVRRRRRMDVVRVVRVVIIVILALLAVVLHTGQCQS